MCSCQEVEEREQCVEQGGERSAGWCVVEKKGSGTAGKEEVRDTKMSMEEGCVESQSPCDPAHDSVALGLPLPKEAGEILGATLPTSVVCKLPRVSQFECHTETVRHIRCGPCGPL